MSLFKNLSIAATGLTVVVLGTVLSANQAKAVTTTISSSFNGTALSGGSYIWFNSVLKPTSQINQPVDIFFTGQTISFTSGGTNYNLSVPNTEVTFSPSVTTATTTFDTNSQSWVTMVPSSGLSGNTFLSALSFQVPSSGLAGGINPVTWNGSFSSDQPVNLNWQWAAADYTQFSTNYNALEVKPVDDNKASTYMNSDHAGTPEFFKVDVTGGATGGGGSNYTGGYSGTKSVTPTVVPWNFSPLPGILVLGALHAIAQLKSKVQKWGMVQKLPILDIFCQFQGQER